MCVPVGQHPGTSVTQKSSPIPRRTSPEICVPLCRVSRRVRYRHRAPSCCPPGEIRRRKKQSLALVSRTFWTSHEPETSTLRRQRQDSRRGDSPDRRDRGSEGRPLRGLLGPAHRSTLAVRGQGGISCRFNQFGTWRPKAPNVAIICQVCAGGLRAGGRGCLPRAGSLTGASATGPLV